MLSAPIAGSLLFAVVVWYVCAVGAVTSSKEVLRATQLPCFLCFTQNLTGCICCLARSYGEATVPMSAVYRPLVLKTGLAYALGFLLTNASIAAMRASVAETVKSIEPVSSVLLAGMCLQEGFPRPRELVGVGGSLSHPGPAVGPGAASCARSHHGLKFRLQREPAGDQLCSALHDVFLAPWNVEP
eukprot:TRINITY_DN3670_c0_g1_i4.p1 TRINITY_DN3670_c0_g1~~TRINITY_DN3670_c0_g1_i4.p1  ORF type:complete len:186 (-),score=26.21 TRINITY_DN3670_c0_g1_i4:370-927(-)